MKHIDDLMHGGVITDPVWLHTIRDMVKQRDSILASLVNNKTIVKGVVNTKGVVSSGIVVYNGKPYTFKGGNLQDNVTIKKIETKRPNASQNPAPFSYEDVMQFGNDGTDTFAFSELKRHNPYGAIIGEVREYYGAISDIPEGWHICDGTNGRPNRGGKVAVGYIANDSEYGTLKSEIGDDRKKISIGNLPRMRTEASVAAGVPFSSTARNHGGGGDTSRRTLDEASEKLYSEYFGNDEDFDVRQSSIVACFIIWEG